MLRYAGESNLKRVALECGGKTPQVVFADADLEAAASGIAWGIYYNSGQTCHAGSRLIVHEKAREPLLEAIRRVTSTITLGHPLEPDTQMGALIDNGHMQRVLGYIAGGVADTSRHTAHSLVLRTSGRSVDEGDERSASPLERAARWHGMGERVRPLHHGHALWRVQALGLRPRPLPARH